MQILYRFKGSVETLQELQLKENNVLGDVWNCKQDNKNYCWNKEEWIDIGLVIDVSGLATKQDIDNISTSQDNIEEEINSHKINTYTMTITEDTELRSRGRVAVLVQSRQWQFTSSSIQKLDIAKSYRQ